MLKGFEVVGIALDKDTDARRLMVIRHIGSQAFFICGGRIDEAVERFLAEADTLRVFDARPNLEAGLYQHSKGGLYDVLGVGPEIQSFDINDEWWVVYRDHDTNVLYARTHGNFTGINDDQGPRFVPIAS